MSSQYDDLEKLADLKNKGIITEEEFNLKKAQILNSDSKTTNTKPSQQEKDQHPQSSPDGHLKIPHLWPGQNPPPRWSAERV